MFINDLHTGVSPRNDQNKAMKRYSSAAASTQTQFAVHRLENYVFACYPTLFKNPEKWKEGFRFQIAPLFSIITHTKGVSPIIFQNGNMNKL